MRVRNGVPEIHLAMREACFLISLSLTLENIREGNDANSNPDKRLAQHKIVAEDPGRL